MDLKVFQRGSVRSLSLAACAVVCLSVGTGFARASYLGQPFHVSYALTAHRMSPMARALPESGDGTALYIVRLKDAPAALYTGGVAGYAATSAHIKGQRRLDSFAPETRAYVGYLDGRQADLLSRAGRALNRSLTPRFRYHYALNGMSFRLTRAEAVKLAQLDGVVSVEPVRAYRPAVVGNPASAADTNASRAWINAPSVWAMPSNGNPGTEGEGIVVGDIDTGINDANSSFAASSLDGYTIVNPLGSGNYLGVCSSSPPTAKPFFFNCNSKLIGAYSYTLSTGNDPNSPEDSDGHGSHTASTAVGDFTTTTVNGVSTPLSGVAPHANLIVYDVCDPTDQCLSDGAVEAIDQAIQDQTTIEKAAGSAFKGMVLNYSIGGGDASTDPYTDPVEQAFLSAVEAGIYVSAAAGNGGPENVAIADPTTNPVYPVEHVVPWIASNAAATHSGVAGPNDVENFSGGGAAAPSSAMVGAGNTAGLATTAIVYAGYSVYSGRDPAVSGTAPTSQSPYPSSTGSSQTDAAECLFPFQGGTFPAGSIVVCDRGTNPLVDKAYNAEQGGASGVVIAPTSTSLQDMPVEQYVIPGTLIDQADANTLRTWLNVSPTTSAQAQLSGSVLGIDPTQADQLAGFSSRGPTDTVYDNLVKPDLTAPGVAVLAALANPTYTSGGGGNVPETFGFDDGTSMATPHDTGAAALLTALHPSWSPAEIRSALMLTAVTGPNSQSPNGLTDQCASLDSGNNCVAGSSLPSPQVRGAGRIDLDAARRTGLVMDANVSDYNRADPDTGGDLTAINLPGVANNNCITTCSWTRTVTSAFTTATATYSVSVNGLSSGLQLTVSPTSFQLAPGATQVLTVSANSGGVPAATWAFGEIDITSSDTGDSGGAIPAMHLSAAVQSVAPSAHMSIDQTTLSFSVQQGASSTQQFTISNDGQVSLNWNGITVAGTSSQSLAGNVLSPAAGRTLSTSNLWTRASAGANGFPSSFYTGNNHGVYSADVFTLPVKADIAEIVADGFAMDDSGPVSLSGTVNWYIYADAAGHPAGNPEDGKNDYVWHYSADAASNGVSVANGIIGLDLGTAGQPDAELAAGSYWLIVTPTFNGTGGNASDPTWYWFEAVKPYNSTSALVIDPGNLYGTGTSWETTQVTLAFTLSGTFDCGGSAMTGLSLSPRSGSVPAGGSATVTATYAGGSQAVGSYSGAVCVSSNASDNPSIPVSVTASVIQSSGGSGGGGGGMGLFALAGLGFALRRKRS